MFKIKANDNGIFNVDVTEGNLAINGEKLEIDLHKTSPGFWSVLYRDKSYVVELVDFDRAQKTCKLKVNQHCYSLGIEDKFDELLRQLGMDYGTTVRITEIKAPMPGLVLSVKVKENDAVLKGDSLLVLEAMKMENILKSPVDGVIKKIVVASGDKVEKNQSLIIFD